MRSILRALPGIVPALVALSPTAAGAQSFPELGARALGLGGAYVAVADGPTATYWNPAALPLIPPGAALLYSQSTSDPEGLDVRLDDLAATEADADDILSRPADAARALELLGAIGSEPNPVNGQKPVGSFFHNGSYGLSIYRLTLAQATPIVDEVRTALSNDPTTGLPFNTSTLLQSRIEMTDYVFTTGFSLGDPRALGGVSLRYTRATTRVALPSLFSFPDYQRSDVFDVDNADETQSSSFSWDVGTLLQLHPRLRVGVVGKYLGSPEFETSGDSKLKLDPRWRSGMAFSLSPQVMVSADFDLTRTNLAPSTTESRAGAVGVQVLFAEGRAAVRGGWREPIEGGNQARLFTGGIGFVADGGAAIDVAAGYSPQRNALSLAIEFGYRKPGKKK